MALAGCVGGGSTGEPGRDDPACADSDHDSVCDADDICPDGDDRADVDGDSTPDACDPCPVDAFDDSDGDGVCDSDDVCPGGDDSRDQDRDGAPDACDLCPMDPGDDSDGDGVCDSEDLCPGGDDRRDRDGDGDPDTCDNCPDHRNADQRDTDGDGYGDLCDRPDDAPDVVIFAISGHNIVQGGHGLAPYYGGNTEYLWDRDGAPQALAARLERLGMSTVSLAYADELYNWDPAEWSDVALDTTEVQYGFLQIVVDLEWVRDNWVTGYDNPTRVIVMAHSHGDVWAHNALFVVNDIPVDFLIDIDGESRCWEREYALHGDEWAWVIDDYNRESGVSWPFDIGNAADAWEVPSAGVGWDIEDIVPSSVAINLEIQASGISFPFLNDDEDNIRADGTLDGLWLYESVDGHTAVSDPRREALTWAFGKVEEGYR